MARTRVMPLVLAAVLAIAVGSAMLSFVGTPGVVSPRLSAGAVTEESLRMPEVSMQFFGGEPVTTTTTPPPPEFSADSTTVIGATLVFFAAVAANASGFFNP